MLRYALNRVLLLLLTLVGVLVITFIISRVLPGSPVEMMLGSRPTPEQIEAARIALGLDQPIWVQFLAYMRDVLSGDFGTSLRTGQSVISDIGARFAATAELVTVGFALALALGIPLGIHSAVKPNAISDHAARSVSVIGLALPVFFLGLLFQLIFHGQLGWLPLQGRIDGDLMLDTPFNTVTGFFLIDTLLAGNLAAFGSALAHLALPILTLAAATTASVMRVTRNNMIEVMSQDHIKTVIAYGLPTEKVHYRYALRAALVPLLTVFGLIYGYMLGGSVIVEYVFDWPGIGGYAVNSVITNDFPAVTGVTLVLATAYLTVNLAVDLLYQVVDPRLRVS